jgi:hypothetical protein
MPILGIICGIAAVSFLYMLILVWRIFRPERTPERTPEAPAHYWHAIRAQGGATIVSPIPMQRAEALKWVRQIGGPILYVDSECGFIFYRGSENGAP